MLALTAVIVGYFLVTGATTALQSRQLSEREDRLQAEISDAQQRYQRTVGLESSRPARSQQHGEERRQGERHAPGQQVVAREEFAVGDERACEGQKEAGLSKASQHAWSVRAIAVVAFGISPS